MIDNSNGVDKGYEELVLEIKKELPNIILPSMGLFDEVDSLNIDGKEFVLSSEEV